MVEEFLQQWRDVENVTAEKILMLKRGLYHADLELDYHLLAT